jgi:hypothetical protein
MKIVIYANVIVDWRGRAQFPYGIAQFRSYITRHFVTAAQPYMHDSAKAVEKDIIVWAFKDEKDCWYLMGDGFVSTKDRVRKIWRFSIEGARLYPRSVPLDELSYADAARKALNVGYVITWRQYRELIEKASEPVL